MTSLRTESLASRLYRSLYDFLCGRHPTLYPWHFQWHGGRVLYARLRSVLPSIGSGAGRKVLDVGCGNKPYRSWFGPVGEYTGIDVFPGPEVDAVIASGQAWPFPDERFDVVLCTQVLEHVEHLDHTVAEIIRVLKRNGTAVVTVPFLYGQHGAPFDFRRLTANGARALFADVVVESLECQGGVGSTLAILFLNWWDEALNRNLSLRIAKGVLLPFTVLLSAAVNLLGVVLDAVDNTEAFYSNVFMILRKREA